MRESKFQSELRKDIEERLPGCLVLKQDPNQRQGIPDLLVLHGPKWGSLEVKASVEAPMQPNQQHYVDRMDEMSFAAVIHPGNREETLIALQSALGSRG